MATPPYLKAWRALNATVLALSTDRCRRLPIAEHLPASCAAGHTKLRALNVNAAFRALGGHAPNQLPMEE